MNIFDIAKQNQEKAWQVIKNTNIIQIWEDAGAKINLVGSLTTGLLMKHRDIDFHIYSSPLNLADSFLAMARLAENPVSYTQLDVYKRQTYTFTFQSNGSSIHLYRSKRFGETSTKIHMPPLSTQKRLPPIARAGGASER